MRRGKPADTGTGERFALLGDGPPPADPCESFAYAWSGASETCRILERSARAALREVAGSFGPATEALFDLVAASDLLPVTAPTGRIPADFGARCLAAAKSRHLALRAEAAALRAAGSVMRAGRADGSSASARHLKPSTRARLAALAKEYPGEPEEGNAPRELALPGTGLVLTSRGTIVHQALVPNSAITVAGPLVSKRFGLTAPSSSNRAARQRSAEAARRLGRALGVVDAAWPEAGAEIRNRTRLILPLDEPGLVSYSLLHRPGVTFINLRGKSLLDLADDLVHETAHHRLHAIEDATPLFPLRARVEAEEVRYWSPWRRAQRPVRGIYHAAYTFSFRAELFRRVNERLRNDLPVGRLRADLSLIRKTRSESLRERRLVARAVIDLNDASRRALITAAGRRVLERIALASESG